MGCHPNPIDEVIIFKMGTLHHQPDMSPDITSIGDFPEFLPSLPKDVEFTAGSMDWFKGKSTGNHSFFH